MASSSMKFCLIVAFIIFAKCAIIGVGYPVVNKPTEQREVGREIICDYLSPVWPTEQREVGREIICDYLIPVWVGSGGCDIQALTTYQSKLEELTQAIDRLINEERRKGFGFYDLQELTTIQFRLTELIQEVERLMNVEEDGSSIGSGSGLFQEEKEDGSAAPCNPQVLAVIRSKLNELAQEVKRLVNVPAPTVDQTTDSLIDQVCPHGWAHHGRSCFYIIDTPTLKWRKARTMCQQLGGDLAKITTSSENQFVYDLLRKQKTVTHYGVWIGLHRKADNKFYWVDDTPLTGYTAWGSGEPNNSPSHGGENCVHKIGYKRNWPFNAGEWNDVPCNLSGIVPSDIAPVVLCQKKIVTDILSF